MLVLLGAGAELLLPALLLVHNNSLPRPVCYSVERRLDHPAIHPVLNINKYYLRPTYPNRAVLLPRRRYVWVYTILKIEDAREKTEVVLEVLAVRS